MFEHDQGHFTPLDLQEQINELFVRVDDLHRAVYESNNKVADMEKSLALFVHLISDKLEISQGGTK